MKPRLVQNPPEHRGLKELTEMEESTVLLIMRSVWKRYVAVFCVASTKRSTPVHCDDDHFSSVVSVV